MALHHSIVQHLLNEFDNDETADVTVIIGEGPDSTVVRVHSLVVARSEYFKTALSSAFKEGETKQITLPDVQEEHMIPLLKALYSDEVEVMKEDGGLKFGPADLFRMYVLCQRFMFPQVPIDGLVSKLQAELSHTKRGTNAKLLMDLLKESKELSLPKLVHDSLLEGFSQSLKWGKNVIPNLLAAHEYDMPEIIPTCLDKVTANLEHMNLEMKLLRDFPIVGNSLVRVAASFESDSDGNDSQVNHILVGDTGTVAHIDDDGDANIKFKQAGLHWVMMEKFCKLQTLSTETAKCYPSEFLTKVKDQVAQAAIAAKLSGSPLNRSYPNATKELQQLVSAVINAGHQPAEAHDSSEKESRGVA